MDQLETSPVPPKPEWALTRSERKRKALLEAGIEPRKLPWAIAVGVMLVAGAGLYMFSRADSPKASTEGAQAVQVEASVAKRLLPVDVATAEETTLAETLKANGTIMPRRTVALTSQVGGTVEAVSVRIGDHVQAGQELVSVDVDAATIQLRQQRATADATAAQLAQAKSQLVRTQELAKQGLAPEAKIESEVAAIDALEANLSALRAGVASAELSIRNAKIVAPFDGVVASRTVEPGQVVNAGAALVNIVNLDVMELTVHVPVSASARLEPGLPVHLRVDGLGDRVFEGRVEGVSPVSLQGTRTVPVLVAVSNEEGALRGGMFATGEIVTQQAEGVIGVPTAAVRSDDQGSYVLTIVEGLIERSDIETGGRWNGNTVEVSAGLSAGTVYVASQLDDLEPGMSATVVEN